MKVLFFSCVLIITFINLSLANECGLEGTASRIYQGTKVAANKYPWMAQIRVYMFRIFGVGPYMQCGGSLVDERHVITAAHCVFHKGEVDSPKDIDVHLGSIKFQKSSVLKVSKIIIDDKYNSTTLSGDFAILELKKPVKFSQSIAPICLPNAEKGLNKLVVSGWGHTSTKGGSSKDLLEVDVDYLTRDECRRVKALYNMKKAGMDTTLVDLYRHPKIEETHMCAINKETMGDACDGDSGGPLMHKNSEGRWVLVGIVSGSWATCGETKDMAGLYTRTHMYQKTIRSTVPNGVWVDL